MATKNSWIKKVLAKLNLNDEGKVLLFLNYPVKAWEKAIKERRRQIKAAEDELADKLEDLQEQLAELKQNRDESFLSINIDAIDTVEQRKRFLHIFNNGIDNAIFAVEEMEAQIKNHKKIYEESIEIWKKEIERFEYKLSMVE